MRLPILILLGIPLVAYSQQGKKRFRDAASHDKLVEVKKEAIARGTKVEMKPVKGPGPSEKDQIPDLLSRSDVLCFNGYATIIPKRATLNVPKSVADRVNNYKPGNKLVHWKEFLQNNRGWVSVHEVDRQQARGMAKLPEKVTEQFKKSSFLVIATHGGMPVSVLPYQNPGSTGDESKTTTTNKQ